MDEITVKEQEQKYNDLLEYFKTRTIYNDTLHTDTYVTIDSIHSAIIKVGVQMDKPLNFYKVKAKQIQIREYTKNQNRFRILVENFDKSAQYIDLKLDNIFEYNLSDDEFTLAYELIQRIPIRKSAFKQYRYYKIYESLKTKLANTLI